MNLKERRIPIGPREAHSWQAWKARMRRMASGEPAAVGGGGSLVFAAQGEQSQAGGASPSGLSDHFLSLGSGVSAWRAVLGDYTLGHTLPAQIASRVPSQGPAPAPAWWP